MSGSVAAGLGAMVGAGVFTGLATAASLAGEYLLVAVVIAAVTALLCATPTMSAAAAGTWGGTAGGAYSLGVYLLGRVAAMTVLAGCFGAYVLPQQPVLAALGVLIFAAGADGLRLRIPSAATPVLVVFVLVVLAIVVAACFAIPPPAPVQLPTPAGSGYPTGADDVAGLLPAAGVMFFAFLGFERAVPSARPAVSRRRRCLLIAGVVLAALGAYLIVGVAVLRQLGPTRLALSPTPLRDALAAADAAPLDPLLTAGAAVATAGVLHAVIVGTRRTVSAAIKATDMSSRAASRPVLLPLLLAAMAVAGVLLRRQAQAIELAAACALCCYAVTLSATALACLAGRRPWDRLGVAACLGALLCVLIGLTMPVVDLAIVLAVLVGTVLAKAVSPVLRRFTQPGRRGAGR